MIHDVTASLRRTAGWRRELCKKFPNDNRNELAAKKLEELANVVPTVGDDYWSELMPYYANFSTWADAVSQASRHVEFRNVKTLPAFVNDLVCILAEQHVAA